MFEWPTRICPTILIIWEREANDLPIPVPATLGPWSGYSRSTDAHNTAEPSGLFPCCSPRIHLRPTQASWPKSWLILSVLQVLTHTSPAGGLLWLIQTLSLERNAQFPVCILALIPEYETISEVILKLIPWTDILHCTFIIVSNMIKLFLVQYAKT